MSTPTPRSRPGDLARGEDGAVAVLTALTLIVLMGAAMIAVDAGSAWATRRNLVTDTDAAVLAAAQHFHEDPDAACTIGGRAAGRTEAEVILGANDLATALVDFEVDPADCSFGAGTVAVGATLDVALFFAPVFGHDEADAYSSSIAEWGPLQAMQGMRPIGICSQDPHYQEWVAERSGGTVVGNPNQHPTSYPGATTTVHRVFFEKQHHGMCGDAPGNWGWLDFNDSRPPNGTSALRPWIEDGYPGLISLTPPDCNPESPGHQPCDSMTGAHGGSVDSALDTVRCPAATATADCEHFPIVVYDQVSCSGGGGTTCEYDHVAFLSVVLRGWGKFTGKTKAHGTCNGPSPDPNCPYFDFEFVDELEQGQVGPVPGSFPTVQGIELCGADHDAVPDRCDF